VDGKDARRAARPFASLKARRGVFVGVARNCGPHLPGVLGNLERLGDLYGEASFVFVVSDSQDGTSSILEKWLAAGRRGRLVDLGDLEPKMPLRTERLAFVRNACLDLVRGGEEAVFDHLIVLDLDNVLAVPLSTDAFAKAANWLDAAPARGGVFANGRPRYYDIWALRHETWCPHDCWHAVWFSDPGQDKHDLQIREIFARMIRIPLWLPPVRVLSAFGGIGVYKLKFTMAARYVGVDDRRREICEHVAFNGAVREAGGGLYVYPPLVVWSPSEHLDHFRSFPRRLRPAMVMRRSLMAWRWWLGVSLR
jgi:hypothetical protein